MDFMRYCKAFGKEKPAAAVKVDYTLTTCPHSF